MKVAIAAPTIPITGMSNKFNIALKQADNNIILLTIFGFPIPDNMELFICAIVNTIVPIDKILKTSAASIYDPPKRTFSIISGNKNIKSDNGTTKINEYL